jgi:CubicO group peptidase (beta-lactamase class C family)
MPRMTRVEGHTEPGFEPVADAFRSNFEELGEQGAAFAAYVDGVLVVDLWGGVARPSEGLPWARDTLQLIFSGTKGLSAACMMLLADRGLLDVERPVADYWPEFAAAGKEAITVADLLTHRAGLASVATELTPDDLLEPVALAALLAAQAPVWEGEGRLAYHGLTFGWLCDALVRRIAGESIGRFFATEIAEPLGLEAWIGLPPEHELRVSELTTRDFEIEPPTSPYGRRVFFNPPVFAEPLLWNRPDIHGVECPGINGIATARSVARLYGCLAVGGTLDVRLCSPEAIAHATAPRARGTDPYSGDPQAFGLGFQLQTEQLMFGPSPDAFGHTGAGGSVHGAWPGLRAGFSYCMNEMRPEADDYRGRRLLGALFESVLHEDR